MKTRKPLRRKTPLRSGSVLPKRNRKRGHKFPKNVDERYREYIRAMPCIADWSQDGYRCNYSIPSRDILTYTDYLCGRIGGRRAVECAHVIPRGRGGVDVGNTLPMCPRHHDEQEGKTPAFEAKYGVDLSAVASALAARYRKEMG